ncbi:Eukaryotic translation initiation factor 4E-2 [Morus notabilis]|uniref:Eukaryotic translation initiation factor isoform 4E n=1 Tax=Morus notabilis TaxID=981085 RepID=W9REK0_9ROSA|nr:eukaryotic translation initiation factor [Morus notabilis]EXB74579.1 Eukaryotic translation initiation factor 4E-2 [Morus notabilis]
MVRMGQAITLGCSSNVVSQGVLVFPQLVYLQVQMVEHLVDLHGFGPLPMLEFAHGEITCKTDPKHFESWAHKLERKWTFWFDNQSEPNQGAAWGTSLRQVYTFDTVEEFWCLYDQIFKPSKLPAQADFYLFRTGVEPKWEDPKCANGGKWTVSSNKKSSLDTMWLETLMALIGEQFDEICGVVASVRPRQDKISLWTKTVANEAVQISIGRKWKQIIDFSDRITYSFHDDSRMHELSLDDFVTWISTC